MSENLLTRATSVRNNSYCPYSKVKVASALIADNGKTYTGVNIENSSFGGTVCAERVAIFSAVADGAKQIEEILVLTDEGWPPCGLCRQVMTDFMEPDALIHIANKDGVQKSISIKELMPLAMKF